MSNTNAFDESDSKSLANTGIILSLCLFLHIDSFFLRAGSGIQNPILWLHVFFAAASGRYVWVAYSKMNERIPVRNKRATTIGWTILMISVVTMAVAGFIVPLDFFSPAPRLPSRMPSFIRIAVNIYFLSFVATVFGLSCIADGLWDPKGTQNE